MTQAGADALKAGQQVGPSCSPPALSGGKVTVFVPWEHSLSVRVDSPQARVRPSPLRRWCSQAMRKSSFPPPRLGPRLPLFRQTREFSLISRSRYQD